MDTHKQLTIGLFGFGVVGEGLYKVLQQTPSLKANLKKVCIKNPGKKRNAPASLFTTDKDELLNDPEINVIVEVIDDADAAFHIVSTALKNKKDVVRFTANDMFNSGTNYKFVDNLPIKGTRLSGSLNFGMVAYKLTYTHNFGNKALKEKRDRSTGAEDELHRVHN